MDRLAIRTECRLSLDDTVAPYEVSDEALNFRIDEAQREACIRSSLLVDSVSAMTGIDVVAGTNSYPIDDRIIDIVRAKLPSRTPLLKKAGYKLLDDISPLWETMIDTPSHYILDMDTNVITLSSVPKISERLSLTVSRLPLTGLADDAASPEIQATYHYDLIYWVLHLTYNTRDSQIYNPQEAGKHEALFERRFGAKQTAREIESNIRRYRRRAVAQWQ